METRIFKAEIVGKGIFETRRKVFENEEGFGRVHQFKRTKFT